jgi:hypothetical protein
LLQENSIFHSDEMIHIARRRLFAYAGGNMTDRHAFRFLEDVVDLLAVKDGMDAADVELESIAALLEFYRASFNIERAPSTLPQLPIANIPFAKKFAIAIRSDHMGPDFFVAAFRFDEWATVAKQATVSGKTALHWAAANLGECLAVFSWSRVRGHEPNHHTLDVISSYADIVIKLIRNGADVHACWDDSLRRGVTAKTSPLVTFLDALSTDCDWHAASISDAVYLWGLMLVEAGQSLTKYVVTESEFLRANHDAIHAFGGYELFIVGLEILADSRLTVRVEHAFEVSVWKARPTHMPGAWPSPLRPTDLIKLSPELPDTIIWRPDGADEQEGFHWVSAGAVNIAMHSYLIEPLDTTESHALDFVSFREPQVPGLRYPAIQDDHTLFLVTMTNDDEFRQEIQTSTRRRSASASTINARQRIGRHMLDLPAPWDGTIHQCVTDMRWKLSSMDSPSLRDCVQGRCREWRGSRFRGWEVMLLKDERYVQVARRFAQRFLPQYLDVVEMTSARATERAQLAMGPARPPARS